MTIHVTQTQKLVAEAALAAVGAHDTCRDPAVIEDLVRAMLVIEDGRMQAYMLRGFKWSCCSRGAQNPLGVAREMDDLTASVDWFHHYIENARGEAARRIRGNRVRRIKQVENDAERLQQLAARQRQNFLLRLPRLNDGVAANGNDIAEPPRRRGGNRYDA